MTTTDSHQPKFVSRTVSPSLRHTLELEVSARGPVPHPASSSEVLLSEAATYPLTPAAMLHSSFLPDIDHAGLSRCLGVPELESPVGDPGDDHDGD